VTRRQDIERRLADCLNKTELFGVRCRIEDATDLTDDDRRALWAAFARRELEVKKLYRDWRRRNGLPDEE
jgi:hypothetical protein